MDKLEREIVQRFSDPGFGLWSADKLSNKIKHEYPDVNQDFIKEIINRISGLQQHKRVPPREKRGQYTKTAAMRPFASVHMDIADLPVFATPQNKNIRYWLVVIDVFSRFIFLRTLTTRQGNGITFALESILKEMNEKFHKTPTNLVSDNEFRTNAMNSLAQQYNFIQQFSEPYSKFKTQLVERSIGTLKEMVARYIDTHNTPQYIDQLDAIVHNYNTTKHSSIGTDPTFAIKEGKSYPPKSRQTETPENIDKRTLSVGSRVRVIIKRSILGKGDEPTYSHSIYEVMERIGIKYRLKSEASNSIKEKLYSRHQLLVIKGSALEVSKEPQAREQEAERVEEKNQEHIEQQHQEQEQAGPQVPSEQPQPVQQQIQPMPQQQQSQPQIMKFQPPQQQQPIPQVQAQQQPANQPIPQEVESNRLPVANMTDFRQARRQERSLERALKRDLGMNIEQANAVSNNPNMGTGFETGARRSRRRRKKPIDRFGFVT